MLRRFSFLALIVALVMVFSAGMAMAALQATETYNVTLTVLPSIEANSPPYTLAMDAVTPVDAGATSSKVFSSGVGSFDSNGPTTFTYTAAVLKRTETPPATPPVVDYLVTKYKVELAPDGATWATGLPTTTLDGTTQSYSGAGAGITVNPHDGNIEIKISIDATTEWDDDSGVYDKTGALTITATVSSYTP